MSSPKVELLNIGDELLTGIRGNGHLHYIGGRLSRHGVSLCRSTVVTDEPEAIRSAFAEAWERADVVITTGGLGPTADDLTREAVAEALGERLVVDAVLEGDVRAFLERMGRGVTDRHRRQSLRFESGGVFRNERGTAPGLHLAKDGKMAILLPGPEQELHPMFEEQVLPLLRAAGLLSGDEAYLQLRTCGVGESGVEERMGPVVAAYPGLTVAYCAHQSMVDVRLSSRDGSIPYPQLREIGNEARRLLGCDFVCFGHCTLAEVVFHELRALDKTLAVAESCTGGLLCDAFTNIPGASKVFLGGVVCYHNDAKVSLLDVPECILEQHGAVSPECAVAIATGAAERLSADYGLSVTGFAGPGGGTKKHPVGTIHLGYHSPVGAWSQTLRYTGGRLDVKARAVCAALDWMRRKLIKYKVEEFLRC